MSLATDIAGDMTDVVDGIETVTVRQVNPDTGATVTVDTSVTCLRRTTDAADQPANDGGGVPVARQRFHLQANTCSFAPRKRDVIVVSGAYWIITAVTTAAFGTRYVCETTKWHV